ncbi:MAG: type II CAAX endopeptidase family protein, partial [Clostridia bacterium]|nr:type II CAAX endopeptidase family protein [Clostridia bacterium]
SPVLLSIYLSVVTLSFLGIFLIYSKVKNVNFTKAGLFKFKFGWLNLLICVVIAVITIFGFNSFINLFFYLMELIGYAPDASLPLPLNNVGWLVINLFVLAVLPAVCEELIHRGIILNGLRKFGNFNAILVSALLFALSHSSAMQFFYQFILGIVLGYVLIKTGSILASILVHFLNNAIVIVYNYISPAQSIAISFNTQSAIIAIVLAIVSAVILFLLIRWLKERKTDKISFNTSYTELGILEDNKKFSSMQSRFIFWTACAVSVTLWIIGTFFG